ncbi:hypothetical protein GH714_032629 [Hevea brasiliensis]|uniref:Uncharacterized protein n=1 Tax=Hevea brasiliensis TaxID=3981 RepID=A0A6A6LM47_HEVBR|nr:hypothetical protein GH714_032629 [Hevea brasiliensis]
MNAIHASNPESNHSSSATNEAVAAVELGMELELAFMEKRISWLGIKGLVLESFANLRVTGFAFATRTNAWKALDVVGIGDYLRQQHERIDG